MLKLTDIGPNGSTSTITHFKPGDAIHLWEDSGYVHAQVHREGTTLLVGKNRDMSLFIEGMTVKQVWTVIQTLLKADWVIAEITTEKEASLTATIQCVAFFLQDMTPFL